MTAILLTVVLFGFSIAYKVSGQDDKVGVLLSYPRLAFHPNPEGKTTLIRFNKGRPETYMKYVNATKKLLKEYQYSKWTNWMSCDSFDKYRPEMYQDRACHFSLLDLDDCVYNSFGYEDGQPCILFSLERIYNWIPLPYQDESVPDNIRDLWSKYSVTLKCDTSDAPSRDNIGNLTYYPPHGFPFKFFPYIGQPGWRPPLVFVHFLNPNPAITLFVQCKVYAKNIIHDKMLDTGTVSFELLVD